MSTNPSNESASSTRRQRRKAHVTGIAAIAVPVGIGLLLDWSSMKGGERYFAVAQLGALGVVIGALAVLMSLLAMIDTEFDVRRRIGVGLEAISFFVLAGQYWLSDFEGVFGSPVLTFVQLLTLGMMFAVAVHVFEFVSAMRKRLQPSDETGDTENTNSEALS